VLTVPLVLHVYVLFGRCSVFDCLLNSVTVYHDHANCCSLNCLTGSGFLLLILFIHFCYIFSPCFLTSYNSVIVQLVCVLFVDCSLNINPLNAELNPICHLLALLGAHHILHVSRIRFKAINSVIV